MKFKEEDVKLYEVFSVLGTENTEEDKQLAALLGDEIAHQQVDCSRIAFKEFRDSIAKVHEGYADEAHNGQLGIDAFTEEMYQINRLDTEGSVDYSIGRIVDYEIPLKKGGDANIEIGTISLLTETMDKVYFINAKGKDSEESVLRVVLETITKLNMVSRRRFMQNYNDANLNKFKYYHTKDDIIPAIILFEGTRPFEEFKKLDMNSFVARVVYKYHIHFFLLKNEEKNTFDLLED